MRVAGVAGPVIEGTRVMRAYGHASRAMAIPHARADSVWSSLSAGTLPLTTNLCCSTRTRFLPATAFFGARAADPTHRPSTTVSKTATFRTEVRSALDSHSLIPVGGTSVAPLATACSLERGDGSPPLCVGAPSSNKSLVTVSGASKAGTTTDSASALRRPSAMASSRPKTGIGHRRAAEHGCDRGISVVRPRRRPPRRVGRRDDARSGNPIRSLARRFPPPPTGHGARRHGIGRAVLGAVLEA